LKLPSSQKILIITESIDVEDSSGSKANVALIENLNEIGYEVLVYHYTRKKIHLKGIECVAIKEKKWNPLYILSRIQRQLQNKLKIIIYKPLENIFGFSFTYFNDVNSIAKSLENIDYLPDLVITLSKGASFRPHYAMLEMPRFHSVWMAYIHDPYPFHLYPDPYNWSEPGYKQKINFFKEVSKKCRWAAFPSLLLKDWMSTNFLDFEKKGIIVPHQIQKNNINGITLPTFFSKDKFTLLHAGNLLKQRPPYSLITAFKNFLKKNPSAAIESALYFLGNSSYHQEKLKKLEDEIPQLYISKGNLPYDQVQLIQSVANVNIIIESQGEISPFLPGKFPHCIATKNAILLLGPAKSESRSLLGEEYPFWSQTDDVVKITALIEKLYFMWKKDPILLKQNFEEITEYLSISHLKTTMEKL